MFIYIYTIQKNVFYINIFKFFLYKINTKHMFFAFYLQVVSFKQQ